MRMDGNGQEHRIDGDDGEEWRTITRVWDRIFQNKAYSQVLLSNETRTANDAIA